MTKLFSLLPILIFSQMAFSANICQGTLNGTLVTMTLTGPDSVEFTGLAKPVSFKGLTVDQLNSTDIMTQFTSKDNGGIKLVIQKVPGMPADASVSAPALGSFVLPKCNF